MEKFPAVSITTEGSAIISGYALDNGGTRGLLFVNCFTTKM